MVALVVMVKWTRQEGLEMSALGQQCEKGSFLDQTLPLGSSGSQSDHKLIQDNSTIQFSGISSKRYDHMIYVCAVGPTCTLRHSSVKLLISIV